MSGGIRMSIPMNCGIHPYHTLEGRKMSSRIRDGGSPGPKQKGSAGLRGDSVGVCALSTCFKHPKVIIPHLWTPLCCQAELLYCRFPPLQDEGESRQP